MCWGTALYYTWNVEAVDEDAVDVGTGDGLNLDVGTGDGLNIDWCD